MLMSASAWATPVNINTADAQTIADALNQIGLKKAEAIVAYRNKIGAFKTVDELGQVAGIGDKTLEKNRADILLSEPIAAPASDNTAKKK